MYRIVQSSSLWICVKMFHSVLNSTELISQFASQNVCFSFLSLFFEKVTSPWNMHCSSDLTCNLIIKWTTYLANLSHVLARCVCLFTSIAQVWHIDDNQFKVFLWISNPLIPVTPALMFQTPHLDQPANMSLGLVTTTNCALQYYCHKQTVNFSSRKAFKG